MDRPPAAPAVTGRRARRRAAGPRTVEVDVLVVGAGHGGLTTAHHLERTGLVPVGQRGWEGARGTFVVLDDNPRAGGSWQHRWRGLTLADAHDVGDLPGMPLSVAAATEPAADAVPYYYAQYEEAFGLNVQRPVRVLRVERAPDGERLLVTTRHVEHPEEVVVWAARGVVDASGSTGKPFLPLWPGYRTFTGRQLHSRDVRSAQDLADGPVVVVGGGTAAVETVLRASEVTSTTWVTRRPPQWVEPGDDGTPDAEVLARVEARIRAGLPPGSVVSVTGLPLTPRYRDGRERGVLRARPPFSRVVADGVEWDDPVPAATGWEDGPAHVAARTIVWATGRRARLDHLAPLGLRAPGGGVALDGTSAVLDPRVQLVSYRPGAWAVAPNRPGREAVKNLRRLLRW